LVFAQVFAGHAMAAAGLAYGSTKQTGRTGAFRGASPMRSLRRKEWTLLRHPWLLSRTDVSFLHAAGAAVVAQLRGGASCPALLVPVLIAAAGHRRGLAWLISPARMPISPPGADQRGR
jgi:hypothetical protein